MVGGQRHAPAALPPGKTRYPFYKRVSGPQDRSGRVRKILPPPGFDPVTLQPVASRKNQENNFAFVWIEIYPYVSEFFYGAFA